MGIFSALDQRIAVRYQLAPMDLGERSPTSAITWRSPDEPIR